MIKITVSDLLSSLTKLLANEMDSARIDVEVLMASAMNWQRHQLYAHSDRVLNQDEQDRIACLINRRLQGEPVAYILGQQEFWSMPFSVDSNTLIPRPETEFLVEEALKIIPPNGQFQILDLGAGSGAIALSLAKERPNCFITAVDISPAAIEIAKTNQSNLGIENAQFEVGNWFEKLQDKSFDIIVSNPPYIAKNDPHLKQGDVVFEPQSALSSGVEGLDAIKEIINNAVQHLKTQGWLFLEHGYQQAAAVRALLRQHNYQNITTVKDLSGHDRITFAQKL